MGKKFTKKDEEVKKEGFKFLKGKKFKGKSFRGEKSNDIKWHTKNAQTVADIMSYPFNVINGSGYNVVPLNTNVDETRMSLPGAGTVMTVCADWYLGMSKNNPNSTLNIAASNLYSFMRKHNSGSTNYQSADLFTSVFAGTVDVLANIAYCTKLFGIVEKYSNRNRVIPRILFSGMAIDYDDFCDKLANYRARFNTILAKATSLVMPKEYPIVDQIIALYGSIYVDTDTQTGREQIYNVVKPFHHIYKPVESADGGQVRLMSLHDIVPTATVANTKKLYMALVEGIGSNTMLADKYVGTAVPGSGYTQRSDILYHFSLLLDIIETQINELITDDDYNTMAGDIMKAFDKYGSGSFWTFTPLDSRFEMEIKYSEEFNRQLHNATILPHPKGLEMYSDQVTVSGDKMRCYTVNGYENLLYQNQFGSLQTDFSLTANLPDVKTGTAQQWHKAPLLIDTNEVNPSPENVLLYTRWHNSYAVTLGTPASGAMDVTFTDAGMSSIIMFDMRVYYPIKSLNSDRVPTDNQVHCPVLQCTNAGFLVGKPAYFLKNHFELAPITYIDTDNENTPTSSSAYTTFVPSGSIDNAVPMEIGVLQRSHEVDFNSLLNVPFGHDF